MTKEQRAAANALVAAAMRRLDRARLARGVCRHCGGAVPCWSDMFGDVEVGKRWSQLTEKQRTQARRRIAQSRARKDKHDDHTSHDET